MGILVPQQYFDFAKCSLSNTYIAFSTNDLRVNPNEINALYSVWISHESRLSNGSPIWSENLKVSDVSTTVNVYEQAYTALKLMFPNSTDII